MLDELYKRIISLSKKHNLSHIGSCLTAVGILDEIYCKKKEEDIVILSSGHAGLALYVVLEKYLGHDANQLYIDHGVHPCRDPERGIYLSTGSLGMGITVATGAAIASPEKTIYCVLSDGECAEGSVWESLAFIDKNLSNVEIYVNANGFSAYDEVCIDSLRKKLAGFCLNTPYTVVDTSNLPDWLPLDGSLNDHYKTL
jgi:transketolase